jgi:hypothetical protein
MAGVSAETRSRIESKPREWRFSHLIWLALAAIILFWVVFWAALGKAPLSGTNVVAVLGLVFSGIANVGIGALASGAVIERLHPTWSRFGLIDHIFMYISLASLLVVDAGVAWWLFTSDAGGFRRWLFLGVALAAIAAGALWAWPALPLPRRRGGGSSQLALWPHHADDAPDDEQWRMFTPLTALLGAGLGVVTAAAYLGISAWHENADVGSGHAMPAAVTGINGSYLALGDSYSAGEGLPPFAPGTTATQCDRSITSAYPDLLVKLLSRRDHAASFRFTACSGALVNDILMPALRPGGVVPPQVSDKAQPQVGLVTLTIGGNNAIFSKVVVTCLVSGNCLNGVFPPPGVQEATSGYIPPGPLLTKWGPATIAQIGDQDAALFVTLRRDFPNARIITIGYPYLFPALPAPGFPYFPPMCASILNRLSAGERAGIRTLQDELNNRIYEEAAVSGIEFVSPVAIWDSHEPCGASGQFTNSVKPYLNFANPVNGGSFHPNAAGQQTLAALLACYLDQNQQPPDPFAPGALRIRAVPAQLVTPAQLHMVPAPGKDSVPGSGTIPGC